MPVGPYETFGECVGAQKKKGKSDLSARKICGQIEKNTKEGKQQTEAQILEIENQIEPCSICSDKIKDVKNTYDDLRNKGYDPENLFNPILSEDENKRAEIIAETKYNLKSKDKYFIKAFLFSPNINLNDWGVTIDSLHKNINSFMGMPIVLTEDLKHPDNGKEFDSYENTIKYQEQFRVGTIIDIVYEKGTYYAIAEITDEKTKQMFRDNKLPMFVSPGIMHNENTIRKSNWVGIHLAIVGSPAFTVKNALIKGTCEGSKDLCALQLSTAAIDHLDNPNIPLSYPQQDKLDNILLHYYNNMQELAKHKNIILLNKKAEVTSNKMVENTISSDTNNNVNEGQNNDNSIKAPSTVDQKSDTYDLNMCVAQFIERGLDSNTAREICVTALGSQGGMGGGMGGGGNMGGQPGQQSGQPPNRGYALNDKFYNTVSNIINTKNATIHKLQTQVSNYETQVQQKLGFNLDDEGIKQIQQWQQKDLELKAEAKKAEYKEFLKLYETDEELINNSVDVYVKDNISIDSVKAIYSKHKPLEQKTNNAETTDTKTETKAEKPHEMFNKMKEGTYNAETQDNRLLQKSTASATITDNKPTGSVNSILLDTYSVRSNKNDDENTSNNTQKELK